MAIKLFIQSKNIYNNKVTYTLSDFKEYSLNQVITLFNKGRIDKASLIKKSDGSYFIRGYAGFPITVIDNTKKITKDVNIVTYKYKEFKRDLYDDLLQWKNSWDNYVLKLSGPRQVGKTFLLKKFAKENFNHVIYINLGRDTNDNRFMNIYNSVLNQMAYINSDETINLFWNRVFKLYDKNFVDSDDCIVIIDEIQEQPIIFNNIRNFHRNLTARVAVIGSYIGIELFKKDFWESSGDYQELTLNSLSYKEFLKAFDVYDDYMSLEHFEKLQLTDDEKDIYKKIEFYYNLYLNIGGYPDVIHAYMRTGDINSCNIVLNNLINSYINESKRYFNDEPIDEKSLSNVLVETCKSIVDGSGGLSLDDKMPLFFKYNVENLNVSAKDKKYNLKWLVVTKILSECLIYNDIYNLDSYSSSQYYFNDLGFLRFIYSKSKYYKESTLNGMLSENFVYLYLYNRLLCDSNISSDLRLFKGLDVFKLYQKNSPIGPLELDFLLELTNIKLPISLEVKHSKGLTKSSNYLLEKNSLHAVIQLSNTFANLLGKTDKDGNLIKSYKFPMFMVLRLDEFLKTL